MRAREFFVAVQTDLVIYFFFLSFSHYYAISLTGPISRKDEKGKKRGRERGRESSDLIIFITDRRSLSLKRRGGEKKISLR